MKKILLSLSILVFISMVCFGQSGAGSIRGTVKSAEGEVLPGILVTLTSPSIVVKQLTALTNENGLYRFVGLLPGNYQVKFELEGMQTTIEKGIRVRVGKTMSVDASMNLKTLTEEIIVEGKAPTLDRQKATGVASMGVEFLKSLPAGDRSFATFFAMTPGVTGDTAHGSSEMSNAYLLDGVNMGDPSTGGRGVSFGADIMEEVSVQTGGISAEYGSVQGAVVNIVTKSGGNKFSGSASFYYNHESLQSDNTEGTDLYDSDNTTKVGEKFKMEPVFTLGGPIIKDKLWFFLNLSMTNQETYAPNYPHDRDEDIASDQKRYFPYMKLTFQPSQNDKFIVSYNFTTRIRNHRGAHWSESIDTTVIQNSPSHTFNAHWTKTFGNSLYSNLKIAYIDSMLDLQSKNPGTNYNDSNTGLYTGAYWRNKDINPRDRYQLNFDATAFIDDLAGSHELKFGGEIQMAKTGWTIASHDGPGPLTPDMTFGYVIVQPDAGYDLGISFNGGFERKEEMKNYSLFINDTWTILSNLTINLGFRYDYQTITWPQQALEKTSIWNPNGAPYNQSVPETTTPMKWNDFSPRLSAIYDVFSDGSTMINVSWSRYVQPNQTGWINSAHPNGWYYWMTPIDKQGKPLNAWVNVILPPGAAVGIGYKDHDLSAPIADELTIGIEREIFEDWSIGVRYLKKWDKNNIHIVDAAHLDIDALMDNGELNWIDWEPVDVTDTYDNSTVTFYNDLNFGRAPEQFIVNPPGAVRYYEGLEVTLNKRYSKGFAFNLSYVYANSHGTIDTERGGQALGTSGLYADPNAHNNNDGRFYLERRHQLKLTGLVKGPLGINLSGYFKYWSGRRRTRTVGDTDLGINLNQGGRVVTNAEQRGNTGLPNQYELDLRVEKAFKIKNIQLSIFADIFNVFNSNFATSYRTDRSSSTLNWLEVDEILDPRVIRVGAKIEF